MLLPPEEIDAKLTTDSVVVTCRRSYILHQSNNSCLEVLATIAIQEVNRRAYTQIVLVHILLPRARARRRAGMSGRYTQYEYRSS